MTATATQPIQGLSQLEERDSSTGPSIPLTQITQSQTSQTPSSPGSEREPEEIDNTTPPTGNSNLSGRELFWNYTFPKIVNTFAILGVLLALILGISQWAAQDKSIALAKESELVTLALSCSDEKIKYTSICQQFLDKYPDGPAISRRGNISVSKSYYQEPEVIRSVQMDLQYTAVHLAMMNRFLQEQNSRFQSALDNSDPKQSLAQMGDIDEAGKAFLRNMTLIKTASTMQRVGGISDTFTTLSPPLVPSWVIFPGWVLVIGLCFFLAWILLFFHFNMELILLMGLFIYYRYKEYFWNDGTSKN
ncbi:hypothetical protein F5Y12DRAFT_142707 [Xylaria sp. FL1777]|nr:hypothetical protein F5Y12DRAFT_142707 [Xylaria sp. FL1777]